MAKLVHQAIDKALSVETLNKLEEQHSIPENSERIQVPKVNKELWKGFQSKRQRETDLAIQSVQKCVTSTIVMVIKC